MTEIVFAPFFGFGGSTNLSCLNPTHMMWQGRKFNLAQNKNRPNLQNGQ
jgi:hypothetical protein